MYQQVLTHIYVIKSADKSSCRGSDDEPLASIVLLTKTGPRCISFRCKITVSLAQGAVHDAEADVADPVFVRSTIREAMAMRFLSKTSATRLAELFVSFFKLVKCLAMVGYNSPMKPCLPADRLACISMCADGA